MLRWPLWIVLVWVPVAAQTIDASFFEAKIRPVLVTKCYACHSSKLKAPMAGLTLDTKAGARGVIVAGKPNESRLLKALSYSDPNLQMPPTGKLPDSVIQDFAQWIAAGAPDPREDAAQPSAAPLRGMSIEEGRKWWAFQPLRDIAAPAVKNAAWIKNKIDAFVLAKLEEKALMPSPEADRETLVRRVYIDLVGYRPTYEEVQAFLNDSSADAYEKLVDKLLRSEHYGERWDRHWMDVARFGEDNPTSEATNPAYPFAWRYRDWIIEAINKDVPYDRFVKLQLAADQMPDASRSDLRALGYLGAAPIYHKDQRLSAEVIGGFMTDDWDERVDAVSRGLLAMTVACARCHDHKFDPIPTKDYYGLVGIFASTRQAARPLFDVDSQTEQRFLWIENRLFDLHYSANLLTNEASTIEGAAERVARWKAEIESLKAEMVQIGEKYPQLADQVKKYYVLATPKPPQTKPVLRDDAKPKPAPRMRPNLTSTAPFTEAVFDAAQYVDGSDAHYTFIDYKPGEARDFPVLMHGNVATPGDVVPRHFLTVLSNGDNALTHGSGRLDLANKIFSDGGPLAARVIVNRVWGWHFGRALVATASDFGVQGEKPSHAELLDDLAARFVANGWSLKWLHREILLSSAYRQSSKMRAVAAKADPVNLYLWRMNPRRMDIESYRDSLLRAAGNLDEQMYGPSEDVGESDNLRRTVYARVSRTRLSDLLRIYDFPDPTQTSSDRDVTTTSLQQLFIMNSTFMHAEASTLAESIAAKPDNAAKIRALYRKVLARDPGAKELDLALSYLSNGSIEQYAQILMSVNEEIFWP